MPTKIDGTNGVIQAYDFQALTTGFTYTFAAGTQTLVMNPAGTLATGTITMPAAPADGMTITITTTQQITALTIAGNSGQSIGGTQVALMAANSALSFVYRLTNTTWYRTSTPALGNIGTAPVYAARAWVNFDGTGTPSIRASGNVSSITDNGTGIYTVNFTTAMPDANYSWQFNGDGDTSGGGPGIYSLQSLAAPAAGSIQMQCQRINNVLQDPVYVTVAIFR
jgi:hypothetical protein